MTGFLKETHRYFEGVGALPTVSGLAKLPNTKVKLKNKC